MYRVTTIFSGTPVVGGGICRFHFSEAGGSPQAAHAAVVAFWQAAKVYVHSSVGMRVEPAIYSVNEGTGQITGFSTTDAVGIQGTGVGDLLPPASQALIRWRTGFYLNGREVRGRTFVPGQQRNGQAADGSVAVTEVNGLNTAGDALVNSSSAQLVVWSKANSLTVDAVDADTWGKFAVLRRRRD